MPDNERINGWLNASERRGHFQIDRLIQYAEYVGSHFFDADTLRFFNSRVLDTVHFGRGRTLFVTSERFDSKSPRRYTIRSASIDRDGTLGLSHDTVGEFQAYSSAEIAHANAARIVAEELAREPTEAEAAAAARAETDIAAKEAAAERRRRWWTPEAVAGRKAAYDALMAELER